MKTKILSTLGVALFAGVMATSVQAQNARPVTIGAPAAGEASMQSILDTLYGPGTIDANADQHSTGLWMTANSGGTGVITPVMEFEYAGNASDNMLGFFSIASGLATHQLFAGGASGGATATVVWDASGVGGDIFGSDCLVVNCGSFSGISRAGFGFYISGPGTGGNNFYTLDSMNGGDPMAVAYQVGTSTNWVIGFEDVTIANNADMDYNDMVIRVESVVAIPEPETYAMLLAGLAVMGFVARRRQRQA